MSDAGELGLVQQYLDREGRPLSYLYRQGNPSLVLLPGSHQDYRQYLDVAGHLYRELGLLIVELPGHRESRVLPEDPSIESFAADVVQVLRRVAPQGAYVGGHSLGGMVALEVGYQAPNLVRGVIAIEGWTDAGVAKALGGQENMYVTLSPEHLAEQERLRTAATGHRTAEERQQLSGLWTRWSGLEFLQTTAVPVLALWGDRGRPRPALEQMHIPDRSDISLRWFENASHNLPLERPRELAQAMMDFISHGHL